MHLYKIMLACDAYVLHRYYLCLLLPLAVCCKKETTSTRSFQAKIRNPNDFKKNKKPEFLYESKRNCINYVSLSCLCVTEILSLFIMPVSYLLQ